MAYETKLQFTRSTVGFYKRWVHLFSNPSAVVIFNKIRNVSQCIFYIEEM